MSEFLAGVNSAGKPVAVPWPPIRGRRHKGQYQDQFMCIHVGGLVHFSDFNLLGDDTVYREWGSAADKAADLLERGMVPVTDG